MSKEEFLKIQTCVLKVNIHCDGCKQKVKKILQKIDGVYKSQIDSELGKVTVSGNVDPGTLIKKLAKSGKHAEIWGASKANKDQQNQFNNQFKNMQIDGVKGGNNKGQAGQKGGNNQQQPKGGQLPQGFNGMNPQQLQQLQQLKALQDSMKLPQLKDIKMPAFNGKDQNQKAVKFNLTEFEDLSDGEFDDDDDDDDDEFDEDDLEDELYDGPANKVKPLIMGNAQGMPKGMMPQATPKGVMPQVMPPNMMNAILNGQPPQQLMKGGNNGGNNGGGNNGGGNGKKGGGGGNIPVQVNMGGVNNGGGKKGGNGNNNQNQGGGSAQKGGKSGGGQPQDGKNGGGGGGQNPNKNGSHGHGGGGPVGAVAGNPNINANGAKKMNDGLHVMPNMMAMNAGSNVGPIGSMPMGQMGSMDNVPMGQMGQMANMAAVQGLPAAAVNGGAHGGGGGYFQGAGPELMAGNPYYQQQMAAMMMNQQRANGNERFQPMMYARPPPAVNYLPPYPTYPYHPYPPPGEHYHAFSDENTSSCNVM